MKHCLNRRHFIGKLCLGLPALSWLAPQARAAWTRRNPRPVDLDFITSQMKLVRRAEWSPTDPDPRCLRLADGFDRVTVHHAGSTPNFATARRTVMHNLNGMLAAHLGRRYGDIGYHFIVDYGGGVWEGRPLRYEGAHVLSENDRNIGIVMLGNFERQLPSAAELNSLGRVVSLLRQRYGIRRHRVYGHRDLGQSVCPGRTLYGHITRLRS